MDIFTRNLYTNIIDSIHSKVGERAVELSYANSREIFRKILNEIVEEYRCQFLGFNLIRYIHEKEGNPVHDTEDLEKIRGQEFLRNNVSAPSNICEEDKQNYAHILAAMTLENDAFEMNRELAVARFEVLLKENLYLEDDLIAKREITRKDILNFSRGLNLDFNETNALLFRTLESGVLTDTSAADLIERFIIEKNQSILEREQMLAEYAARTNTIRKISVNKREESVTQTIYDKFSEQILDAKQAYSDTYEELRKKCLDYLVEHACYLDAPNRTATRVYRKLLCYILDPERFRDDLNGEYDAISNEKGVFDHLRAILIRSNAECILSKEEQISLVQELLASEDCDTLSEAYTSWSVPGINPEEGKLEKIELGTRMERIVTGDPDIRIQKKDLLFALFLACSLSWENSDETDMVVLRARLDRFINLSNELLQKCHLENDRFYLPHPMEASIAIAIMCGPLAEGIFRDVTESLRFFGDKIRTNSELTHLALPPRVSDKTTKFPRVTGDVKAAYDKLDDSVMTAMHQLRNGVQNSEILWEAADIAQKIRDIWKKHNFRSIEIYFHPNGTWGFIPTASIGKNYQTAGKTPKKMHGILFGDQKLEIVFFRRNGKGKRKYVTLQEWIDAAIPQLDIARTATLHRKAVLYIILGQVEVLCTQDTVCINNEPREFDFSELMNKYGGALRNQDNGDANEPKKSSSEPKLVLQGDAQVKGRRFMKIRGVSMATLEITEKQKAKNQDQKK